MDSTAVPGRLRTQPVARRATGAVASYRRPGNSWGGALSIDWAGRVPPTGTFGSLGAPDAVALAQAALDAVPDTFVAVLDPHRTLLLARGSLLAVDGLSSGEREGTGLLSRPDLAGFWQQLEGAIDAGLGGEACGSIVTGPDDRVLDVRTGPLRDAEGSVLGCVVVAHDVTDRRAVHDRLAANHDQLRESEERFRLLAENSSDFVMRTTPEGVIEWISPGITEWLGWEPDEMVGKRSLEFAHPDYVAQVLAQTSQVNVGAVVSGRLQVRAKDGSYRWMFRTLRPVRDELGEVVARVSGWHDVDAEVAAEERLAASEELFRVAMESSAIGMAIVDREGKFLRVNPAYCRMLEYDADELLSRTFAEVTHPDDVARGEDDGTRVVRGQTDGFVQRKRYITRTGRSLWVDVSVAGVHGPDGSFRHLIVQAVDVSAEVSNFQALQRAARDYQILAENASDVVLRVDEHGILTWVSPSIRTVLGWDPELLVGTPSIALVEHADREKVLQGRRRILDGGAETVVARFRTTWGTTVEMSGSGRPLRSDDGSSVVGSVIGLRDVGEEMAVRRELAYRASHDALTGMLNRDDVMSRLRTRLDLPPAPGDRVGLLFCDVDELKLLNDTYGHATGDAVLVDVAHRLEAAVRRHDVVARLSGDEFVVLLDRVPDQASLDAIVDKCRSAVATVETPQGSHHVTISVGGVLAEQDEDADSVIQRADFAMLEDKRRGQERRGRGSRGNPLRPPTDGTDAVAGGAGDPGDTGDTEGDETDEG